MKKLIQNKIENDIKREIIQKENEKTKKFIERIYQAIN